MWIAHRRSDALQPRGIGRTCLKIVGITAVAGIVTLGGRAQAPAPAASGNGAIAGLEPKFADVKALGGTIKTRYYEAGGSGEPMVLVHGGGMAGYYSANVWSTVLPGLGRRFHVFAPDRLAAGMTDNPPNDNDYNIQGEVEHIHGLIQTMGLGRVHLVGQSHGAGISLMLAMKYPEVVKTLVLVDSATAAPETSPATRGSLMAPCSPDRLENYKCEMYRLSYKPTVAFPDEYFGPADYMGKQTKSQTTMAKVAAGAGRQRVSEYNEWKKRLHERLRSEPVLPMPVLLFWGYNDPQATRDRAMGLYDILAGQHPNVWLVFVNRAGHFHWREYPDQFVHNVTSFIDYWTSHPPAPAQDTSHWTTIRDRQ